MNSVTTPAAIVAFPSLRATLPIALLFCCNSRQILWSTRMVTKATTPFLRIFGLSLITSSVFWSIIASKEDSLQGTLCEKQYRMQCNPFVMGRSTSYTKILALNFFTIWMGYSGSQRTEPGRMKLVSNPGGSLSEQSTSCPEMACATCLF